MSTPVNCPQCGRQCDWRDNPWRPFCSERCKLIDLGAWFDGRRGIPGEETDTPDDQDEPKH